MDKQVLSREGLNKAKEELSYLCDTKRREVAERIKQAKEFGDLSENAEYQEAKEEQSFVEGRIRVLEHLTKTAEIVEEKTSNDTVYVGSQVKVDRDGQIQNFTIVGSTEADPINSKISLDSPIGKALLDKKVGDKAEVELPVGKTIYKILEIK